MKINTMDYSKSPRIFVIGFFGSDRKQAAEHLAAELGYEAVDLDEEIEKKDGRSVSRICMMMGEHEYRNQEYERLKELAQKNGIVVCCGDGVVLDDMSMELLKKNDVLVADADLTPEELWEKAKKLENPIYAFMHQGDEGAKKSTFMSLYEQRKPLYSQFVR